jgi:hypothetical protein
MSDEKRTGAAQPPFNALTASKEDYEAAKHALDNPKRAKIEPFVAEKDPLDPSSTPQEFALTKAKFERHYRGY